MTANQLTILHISDMHFTKDNSQKLASSLYESPQLFNPDRPIDFIAVTGDLTHKGNKNGFDYFSNFLDKLIEVGIERECFNECFDRSHVLIVPGNHDLRINESKTEQPWTPPNWDDYSDFIVEFYEERIGDTIGKIERVDLESDTGTQKPSAYLIDHRKHYGVVFLLFNCFAGVEDAIRRWECGDKEVPDLWAAGWMAKAGSAIRAEIYREVGYLGKNQLDAFENKMNKMKIDDKVDKISLIHNHLFPMKPSIKGDDLMRRTVLIDFPQVVNWLSLRSCACILHGHRHRPFLGNYIVRKSEYSHVKGKYPGRRFEEIKDFYFDDEVDVIVTGVGELRADWKQSEPGGQERLSIAHLITVNLQSLPGFDPKLSVAPFYRDRNSFRNRQEPGERLKEVYSDPILPDFLRKLYEAETFFSSQQSVHTGSPLIRMSGSMESVEAWFWEPLERARRKWIEDKRKSDKNYWNLMTNDPVPTKRPASLEWLPDPQDQPVPETARDAVLCRLIKELYTTNRKNSVFSILPFQLEGIYTYTQIFYSNDDIDHWAEVEFSSSEWKPLLEAQEEWGLTAPKVRRHHIDEANKEFAKYIAAKSFKDWRKLDELRILEIGFGALRTIFYVIQGLSDQYSKIEKEKDEIFTFEYLGYDVNAELTHEASKRLEKAKQGASEGRKSAKYLRRIEKFPHMPRFLYHRSAYDALCKGTALDKYEDKIDCFLASYCMHHISNYRRIRKSLIDGTFYDLIGEQFFLDGSFIKAVESGIMFKDLIDDTSKTRRKLAQTICEARDRFMDLKSGGKLAGGKANNLDYLRRVDSICDNFEDRQLEIYKQAFELLRPGGVICLADPNGFSSTFNRQQICHDWPLSIAHFADWDEVLKDLDNIGFTNPVALRQIRTKSLDIKPVEIHDELIRKVIEGSISINDVNKELIEREEIDPLEIEDQHLGYIIMAQKPIASPTTAPGRVKTARKAPRKRKSKTPLKKAAKKKTATKKAKPKKRRR